MTIRPQPPPKHKKKKTKQLIYLSFVYYFSVGWNFLSFDVSILFFSLSLHLFDDDTYFLIYLFTLRYCR